MYTKTKRIVLGELDLNESRDAKLLGMSTTPQISNPTVAVVTVTMLMTVTGLHEIAEPDYDLSPAASSPSQCALYALSLSNISNS